MTQIKKSGLELIASERERQVKQEGWSDEHDDSEHRNGDLALAAACYTLPEWVRNRAIVGSSLKDILWPWDGKWWKPGDRIRELVKAGALIAAEIDRLQRRKP